MGRYEVRRLIDAGGMGEVYEALQERPRRVVALKTMHEGFDLARFEKEWQMLGCLRHPGIVQVIEAGEHDEGRDVIPYFTMEYVTGARPITEYAEASGLDDVARLELVIDVCDALAEAHLKGVVHRDLKPSNILVDSQGRPKIIDFGCAWAADAVFAERPGCGCGTPAYMSPEQREGDPYDLKPNSDVYSLGLILWELLCRERPFHSLESLEAAEPRPPSTVRPQLAGEVEHVILKALRRRREERYHTAAVLGDALKRLTRPGLRPPRRTRVDWIVASLVLTLLALAAGALFAPLLSSRQDPVAQQPVGSPGVKPHWASVSITTQWGVSPHFRRVDALERPTRDDVLYAGLSAGRSGVFHLFHILPQDSRALLESGCDAVEYQTAGDIVETGETIYLSDATGVHALVAILAEEDLGPSCAQLKLSLIEEGGLELGDLPGWPLESAIDGARSRVEDALGDFKSIVGVEVFLFPVFEK